jgi:hypothetical protein
MLCVRLEPHSGRGGDVLLQDMQAAPLQVVRRVARLPERLDPKALRHFVAIAAVLCRFLALLRLFNVKDQLAGVAADEHHRRNSESKFLNAFLKKDQSSRFLK